MWGESKRRIAEHGRQARRWGGFTLVELAVVGALIAILAAIGAPSFAAWHVRERVDAGARALLASLAYARSEAIRRREPVSVWLIGADGDCLAARTTWHGSVADWAHGWAVVADMRGRPGRTVLRRQPQAKAVRIRGAAAEIRFTPPAGQVIGGFRSFEIVPEGAGPAAGGRDPRRCIAIAAGGRARLSEGACGATA